MRRTRIALLMGVVALAATACGGGSATVAQGDTTTPTPTHHHSPRPTVTVTQTVTPTSPPTSASGSVSPTTPTVSYCTGSDLKLSLGEQQGAAGNFYTPVVLTNSGTATCELKGDPGVSYTSSSGSQIGQAASERKAAKVYVQLPPGGSASTMLEQVDPGVYSKSDCEPMTTADLKVYPPGLYGSMSVQLKTTVCTTSKIRSSVSALQPGTSPSE